MKTILTRAIAATAILAMTGVASADPVTYDFNDFEVGVALTDQIEGVTFSLVGATEGPRTRKISNKRYKGADGIALRPSNVMKGGLGGPFFDIAIEFDTPTDFFSILALDSDEPVNATAFLDGEIVDFIGFRGGTNFQVYELELGEIGGSSLFDRVVIDIVTKGNKYEPGPELFDNLTFNRNVVPTPGAFTLLATSGVIAMRRRRIED